MNKVLIIEDEVKLRENITELFESQQYQVATADNGKSGYDRALKFAPDLIVSDVIMPEEDGFELLLKLKNNPATEFIPVIFLTAKTMMASKIEGLQLGADDYIMKPFKSSELLARLRALMRRVEGHDVTELIGNGIVLNTEARTCMVKDAEVALTSTEYQLLELLMRNSGRVISRQQILRDVWNTDWSGSTKNLDMHVSALRRKLGEEGEHISTIRGLGFRFDRT